jgi:hypothetical protein
MELKLRKAQANDALFEIRRGRRNITKLWKYKKVNSSGTGNKPNTRMISMYNRLQLKLDLSVHKYRQARATLLILDPDGTSQHNLKDLRREDIRGPGIEDPSDRTASIGWFEESWIWTVQRTGRQDKSGEDEFNDDMRVEWTKSRARMMRWKEEHALIQEEMRRVLVWLEWKATWWENQASLRQNSDCTILAGILAYSHKQAYISRQIAQRCAAEWLPLLKQHSIEPEWASQYNFEATELPGVEEEEVIDDDDDEVQNMMVNSDNEDEDEEDIDGFEFED